MLNYWHKGLWRIKKSIESYKRKVVFYYRIPLAFSEYYYSKEKNIFISLYVNLKFRNVKFRKIVLKKIISDTYNVKKYKKIRYICGLKRIIKLQ